MLRKSLTVFVVLVLMLEPASLGLAQSSQIIRVSVKVGGGEPNSDSFHSSISSDGRYVAFASGASDLVAGDTNGAVDIFVRDLLSNTTTIVSVATDGTQANNGSSNPAISPDGRYVAFESLATNLVPGDTNDASDIFVRDLHNNTTTRVSVTADGAQANGISSAPDISLAGPRVTFVSTANLTAMSGDDDNDADVFVRDLQNNTTIRVSVAADGGEGWGVARNPSISADGRYVVFDSDSPNLVTGDTNNKFDIFVRDLQENTATRVSIATDGTQANDHSLHPDISNGGDMVAFESYASNLVPEDTNGKTDIFVRDLWFDETRRVSVATDGTQANNDSSYPVVASSPQWYYVAFESYATNLVPGGTENKNVFLYYYSGHQSTSLVSLTYLPPSDPSLAPAISSDGRYVTFHTANAVIEGETHYWMSVYRYTVPPPVVSPIVVSITRADPNPTTASYVRFDVTFSEAVNGVDTADFAPTATGTITGTRVSSVTKVSSEKYQVTVYTGGGSGTLRLDVPVGATVTDLDGNALTRLPYTSGEAYTLERPVTLVRADVNPTSAASVRFNVIFAENALDVVTDDFSIRETDSLTGSSITSVSGYGWFYQVTVQVGSGSGTLHLDIPETATILDEEYNNLLAGLLPYTQGEYYDVIKTAGDYKVFLPLVLR